LGKITGTTLNLFIYVRNANNKRLHTITILLQIVVMGNESWHRFTERSISQRSTDDRWPSWVMRLNVLTNFRPVRIEHVEKR
jgi:hypothetical protein